MAAAGPVVSVIRYGRAARRFLLRAKFGGHPELFGPMGRMVTAAVRLRGIRPSCVVPVPSHPFDTWARGFTPGLEIARTVAAALGLPVRRHLVRRWAPRASMKRLDRASRKSLSVRAFRPVEPVRGETVLVVDDLLTTGSTLSACIAVCAAQGASEIHAAVWAKAPSFFN
ncbi:MAG: hypothetical protein GTO30_13380 [Acidobacteria bacterium]|nr:hypothetical protein [Acidobacteriota bacterium]NIO60924.1 hypothetical protein [Acidobacteriota bacterium]NIQ87393.1 hypothetical protein [Acidobacteriota bacterium]